jgi:hypothetical protein
MIWLLSYDAIGSSLPLPTPIFDRAGEKVYAMVHMFVTRP